MITAGIDMGSRSIKVILLEELNVDGAPQLKYGVKKAHIMMPGDLDQDVAADKAYDEALASAGLKREDVKVGDTVRVRCHRLRDGSNGCLLGFLTPTHGDVARGHGIEKEWD